MNTMAKKWCFVVLALAMVLVGTASLAGCSSDDGEEEAKLTGAILFVPNIYDGVERNPVTQQFEYTVSEFKARVKLQKNPFSSEYYAFSHWSKYASAYAKNRDVIIADEAEETLVFDVSNPYKDRYGYDILIVLFAEWEPLSKVSYTVVYDANGGRAKDASISTQQNFNDGWFVQSTRSFKDLGFTRFGYTSNGWNTEPDGSGTQYAEGQIIAYLTEQEGTTVTLYAQWTQATKEITVAMSNVQNIPLDSTVPYYRLIVTGEYTDLGMQYLKQKLRETDTDFFLDLSSLTGTGINSLSFAGITNLVAVVLPDAATKIADSAFNGCTSLESVTMGSAITAIGNSAFSNCSSLETITIPDSVTSIADSAFSSSGLISVDIGTGLTTLPFDCPSLKTVTVADGNTTYKSIDGIAYSKDGTKLVFCPRGKTGAVTVDSACTAILDSSFRNCTKLTDATISENVQAIGEYAFGGCTNLTDVTIGENVQTIGKYAFFRTGLMTILFPASITQIGEGAFSECGKLATAYFAIASGWTARRWTNSRGLTLTLTDAEQNAKYLTDTYTYAYCTWTRTE